MLNNIDKLYQMDKDPIITSNNNNFNKFKLIKHLINNNTLKILKIRNILRILNINKTNSSLKIHNSLKINK
jgi:hypothetical protein